MIKKFLLLLVFALPLLAGAQAVPATDLLSKVGYPFSSVGNVSTVLAAEVNSANAARFAFSTAANGSVWATGSGVLSSATSSPIPLSVVSEFPKAQVAAAIGRFASKVVTPLVVGVALYDLYKELGFTPSTSNGSLGVTQFQAGPTSNWHASGLDNYNNCPRDSAQGYWVCAVTSAYGTANNASCASTGAATAWCGSTYNHQSMTAGTVGTPSEVAVPNQTVIDAIAAKSGWPVTSALARTAVDAIRAGEVYSPSPLTVTGPLTSPGPKSVSVDPVTGNTTTVNTTNNYSYAGPVITQTSSTSSSVVNTSTGAAVGSPSIKTDTPVPPPVVCGVPGAPACSVKVDEGGTPTSLPEAQYQAKVDAVKTTAATNLGTIGGASDKGFLSGWSSLFSAPAVVACTPIVLPNGMGNASMGSLNPCPVVDGVRAVMAYLWALGAFWLCLGMVKRTF